jgi:hypothetical protein
MFSETVPGAWRGSGSSGLSGLFGFSGSFSFFHSGNETNQINQSNQTNQIDPPRIALPSLHTRFPQDRRVDWESGMSKY